MAAKTILIIENDADTSQVLSYILTEEGYNVMGAETISGLQVSNLPALIILDNWLNGISGHDICKQLKSNPQTNKIPIILLSATANLEQTAKSCGADDYINKPFDIVELIAKVAGLIASPYPLQGRGF